MVTEIIAALWVVKDFSFLARLMFFTLSSSGRVLHHISGKNERIQTKLGRKKLRHKGNPHEDLGAYSMRGAPTFLSVHMSPVR